MVITGSETTEDDDDKPLLDSMKTKQNLNATANEMDIGSQLKCSILPLLQSQPTCNLTKHDVIALVKSITKLEPYILDFSVSFNPEYAPFFSSFVALSANCIVINAGAIPKSRIQLAASGCSILLKYLLQCLQISEDKVMLIKNQTIGLIQGLCDDVAPLMKSDVISLCAILKSSKIPPHLLPKQNLDRQNSQTTKLTRPDSEDVKEPKRMRLDHTCESLVEQLITPILDVNKKEYQDSEKNIISGFSGLSPSSKATLLSKNLFCLQQLGGATVLLDFVLSLNTVHNYIQPVLAAEEGAPLKLPSTVGDAFAIVKTCKTLLKEYDVMWRVLSLPILEPLTEDKLNKVITIIHTCLYISLSLVSASSLLAISGTSVNKGSVGATASGASKDEIFSEDSDNYLVSEIIDTSLEIYRRVTLVMKNSLRVGGQCCQNTHLFACWLLLSGVKYILNMSPYKSTHKNEDSATSSKGKQGYTTLCIPLVSHALKNLTALLDDLKFETGLTNVGIRIEKLTGSSSGSFKHNKFGCYSAWQRIEMLMSNINVTSLLFSIASVSYRKAGMLRLMKHNMQQQQQSASIAAASSSSSHEQGVELTPTNQSTAGQISDIDDECCFSSDDSSRDEDSEPILGQLFKENDRDEPRDQESHRNKPRSPSYTIDNSDKREPHRHLSLALQIFELFNTRFVCSELESIRTYLKATLNDAQVIIIANIIKDLDRESALPSAGFYSEFSRTLSSFVHNLIATESLSSDYQTLLLVQLGVNPSASANSLWPLHIPPRTLSVLAQVLLLRNRKDKDELRSDHGAPCLFLWQNLLNHLKSLILESTGKERKKTTSTLETNEMHDLNVEHAQLLLFIFHNLKLLQRKNVLLMVSHTIVEISKCVQKPLEDYKILFIARILHFFEYMMKNLYEPPHALIEQIDNNLLKFQTITAGRREKDNNKESASGQSNKSFFSCRSIEENYIKHNCSDKVVLHPMKPRFYYLMNVDASSTKDVPKLDGMALNFVLVGISDMLYDMQYDDLYDALVRLLLIGNQVDAYDSSNSTSSRHHFSYFGVCSTQYCFNIVWRLFLQMPPSLGYLQSLGKGNLPSEQHKILHAVIWIPRLTSNKWFYLWTRDALVKLLQNNSAVEAENLLKSVVQNSGSVVFSVRLLNNYISKVLSSIDLQSLQTFKPHELPKLFDMFVLETLVAKTMVALDMCFNLNEHSFTGNRREADNAMSPPGTIQEAKLGALELLPSTIRLITLYYSYIRWSILRSVSEEEKDYNDAMLLSYNSLLKVTSSKSGGKVTSFTLAAVGHLPKALTKALDKWNSLQVETASSPPWKNETSSNTVPSEVFISNIVNFHFNNLSSWPMSESSIVYFNGSLKRLTHTLLRFGEEIFIWALGILTSSNHHQAMIFDEFAKVVIPLNLDASLDSFYCYCSQVIDPIWGNKESDDYYTAVYVEVLSNLYDLLVKHTQHTSEKILVEAVKFMESLLDAPAGQAALEKFFCDGEGIADGSESRNLLSLLKAAVADNLGSSYATSVLKFLSKLFEQTEKNPDTVSLVRLCTSLSCLSNSDSGILQSWLSKIICAREENGETNIVINQENRSHLQNLTSYIVKENSTVDENVAYALLSALIPMSSHILSTSPEVMGFPELMIIMATLAGAGAGTGHISLIKSVVGLLETCKNYLFQKDVLEKLERNVTGGRHQVIMESACFMLSYLADVFEALKLLVNDSTTFGRPSSPVEGEIGAIATGELDSDWVEDITCADDDESTGEESDEDSLCNKLCTFTVTQKEFMNQHWYHCHTCKMVDGMGVCTVCARVCHKDHDVTYAKYGSFFCDCGAKTDGSCQALMKRVPSTNAAEPSTYRLPAYSNETDVSHALPSSLRRRSSSVDKGGTAGVSDESSKRKSTPESQSRHQMLARQLLSRKNEVISLLSEKNVSGIVLELLQHITPSVMVNCQKFSPVGCSVTARKELSKLHTGIQRLETSDSLMVPTLGSQEGAFENVRLNYSGEQGQTIRQLISTNVVRRVAMCALTSPYGKRQHLAVSHEKGKITLLQLSALLKQADSSKRKLTLTRLVSAPIPFTALSVAANPCNEDLLAVCGLKDCHILTFNQSGHVSAHVGLQPQLEAGNYVIKPVWLPGEQTKLALVTADFVKIYDLSASVTNPEYFYLLPSGKIRDVTFVFTESGSRYLLIISSMGYIYCQIMNEQSCARNGHFYVTTILEVRHNEIKETTGGFINSGGVSIYYSHAFQLLFFSYVNGKSVVGPLKEIGSEITNLFLIEIRSNGASNNNGSSKSSKDAAVPQPLCQWSEVPGHPGLILAMCQQSNNPVIFMVKPDAIVVQKIKFLTVKAKITDMVALRHATSPGEMRTTLILLCEDGSLRIYMAAQDTNYWLRPTLNTNIMFHGSGTASASSKLSKKKKSSKSRGSAGAISLSTSGSGSYPVDFFEHCTALNDVEFGGNDVLHVYNTQQLKNRLNTVGMYVASTKPVGFTIEVINNDPSMVMVGVRILVGTQDINKAPSCIDMFERSVRVYLTRSRWYDFPFTREESLMADKKFSIFFGASGDSSNVTMVDSIKVYGKTKESLSWPEDENEYPAALPSGIGNCDVSMCTLYGQQLSSVDRLLSCSLEVLDGAFTVNSIGLPPEEKQRQKQKALEIATSLLTLPFPILVQKNIKYLLLTLHENRALYNNHRDSAILNYVVKSLIEGNKEDELDGEAFYRLIFVTRSIANSRPNNLIKFGECLSLAKMSSEASRKDPVDIEMTTFTSNQKSQSLEISGSQSCYELSGPGTKNEATNVSKKQLTVAGTPRSVSFSEVPTKESNAASSAFITYLNETFWKLYSMRPSNPLLPTVAPRGLVHIDATVQALVEIIHAFTLVDVNNIDVAAEVYMKLFLCKDPVVSFGAKQALVRVLRPKVRKRKVFIPSPPHCETPSGALHSSDQQKVPSQSLSSNSDRPSRMASQGSLEVFAQDHNMAGGVEQQFDLIEGLDEVGGAAGGVEELMVGPSGQFAPLLDLPVDADDEAMVELAIALSLQDQQVPGGAAGANNPPHRVSSLDERGHFSDTTASAAASDDEGSTAATDGSTLRTSPVINEPEQVADGVGSESGASGAESIIGEHLSGRSSAYGEDGSGLQSKGHLIDNTETNQDSSEFDMYDSNNQKLHNMRILLLEKLVQRLPEIGEVGGVNSIPMMQVILMLSTDLDNEGERDKAVLHALLAGLVRELRFNQKDLALVAQRTPTNEVKLILMRLLSILMSRTKITPTASSTKIAGVQQTDMSTMPASCSVIAAQNLIHNNCIDACYQILYSLLNYWKTYQQEIENSKNTSTQQQAHPSATATSTAPIKARSLMAPPDMSPFFLKLYVKSHGDDVFELYTQLLTEMALRLPYQIKKLSTSIPSVKPVIFQKQWLELLCDYMMIQLTPYVRKHVRKLLSFICGSKEKYRQIRDFHALDSHMKEIRRICKIGGFTESSSYFSQAVIINLSYDSTISLIEHLKACCEIASSRVVNWQKFCQKEASVLPFFIQTSFLLDEGVSPVVLQLLQLALCAPVIAPTTAKPIEGGIKVPVTILQGSNSVSPTYPASAIQNEQQALDAVLARQLILQIDSRLLSQFIQCFLLESNSTSLRWQAHSLIFNLYKSFEGQYQEQLLLLETLWSLWHKVPSYGRKAVQFVDLLGYFTLKINTSEDKQREYTEKALSVLRQQNKLLMNHPNSAVYNTLQTLVEFDGYYLESEPCLVCNNPEVNYSNMKLSSVKVDSRFTTTTHIVKLVGSLTITKISLRISDIKRSKMVKTLNLYYNNRAVHSVVELKNKSNIWHKAKKCNLSPVQTEVKIEFTLPIVACNLMIEYGDFYENIQASSETLQCPRCSASVAANPGVCGNCGENVFQCHKCRAINYDEKDPFLCNSCGFCKYAKFDYILTAKPTCAVDPIENEDDRKKTVQTINTLLEKADRVYKTLIANKPFLEVLLFRIQEHGFLDKVGEDLVNNATPNNQSGAVGTQNTGHVNKVIHQVAQKYCGDCKTSFDELSKIIQKVLASRKELVDYDNRQRERNANPQSISQGATRRDSKVIASLSSASGRCYGCASATTENCITLLKALTTVPKYLDILSNSGLLKELLNFNLKNGKSAIRHEVRHLLCTLTNNNPNATAELNNMIMDKITTAFQCKYGQRPDLSTSIRHEIALLVCSFGREDNCWEQRLKCVMQLFLISLSVDSPAVLEAITLPCLKLLISLIKPEPPASKKFKDKSVEQLATVMATGYQINVDLHGWLNGDPRHSFKSWQQRTAKKSTSLPVMKAEKEQKKSSPTKHLVRQYYLMEKFGLRWKSKVLKKKALKFDIVLQKSNWLRSILFNRFSRTVRLFACQLVEALFQIPSRRREIIDVLTSYLDELGSAGEFSEEFFMMYHSLVQQEHWKYYLALQGVLQHLGTLITKEIDHLNELEETTLNSDLTQGIALKMLIELLSLIMEVKSIKQHYKSRLVAFVLNGYLSLRKLVVQRTKIIDEAQETLLELLEEMTSGNETETASFMSVCVVAINKCRMDDLRTPVFIFERLCSIIYPEENDTPDFYITLEKDPQQEDFLQGRMLGNPYSSNEQGMGPLMRDIKNKICQDCELVALLEDDSGMELLVRNKIISLDLPVKEVYKKVWCAENNESDNMRIVYRMRGLMGDATEEFVETLDSNSSQNVDNEVVYRMANVMSRCGGIQVMLQRLSIIKDLSARSRPLLLVLLKLFGHCINVSSCRKLLIQPSLNAIAIKLKVLQMFALTEGSETIEGSSGKPSALEQLLQIMEKILAEASEQSPDEFDVLCKSTCGTTEDIKFLLSVLNTPKFKSNQHIIQLLLKIIPLLTVSENEKIKTLLDHFTPYLNFKKFDYEHTPDDDFSLDCFAILVNGIPKNGNGNRLKDCIVGRKIVSNALEYLTIHAPATKSLLAVSDEWKEFTQRPALKYVLRILTGLSSGHEPTQLLVSADSIPVIHGLEQVSSDSHVGSLAEILLESLLKNPTVAKKIQMVRKQTREEKKRLAMAVRQKQLGELGMRANEKGQVTASSSVLKQVEDLGEEQGLTCIICREGYKFQPTKVIGIYTFTKKCNVEPFESKPRKTVGYSTVTHFNVVHVDCHMAAVRHARGRDEWESAALQNANTRCNGLLPLWGPSVQESAFASALARHNAHLQESTGHRDINYASTIHDLKLLLLKFASEESFSVDTGGGGHQSNIHLIPYLIHMALYVVNSTRTAVREHKKVVAFLELPKAKWVENAYEAEGPFYFLTMFVHLNPPTVWIRERINLLRRVIVLAHARYLHPKAVTTVSDKVPKEYTVYKAALTFFALIDGLYNILFKNVYKEGETLDSWTFVLADFIRNNDQLLMENGDRLLRYYEQDVLTCQTFEEYCDVVGLLTDISDPQNFIANTLLMI